MAKRGVIDRFEEDWAVIELDGGEITQLPAKELPPNAMEGSVVSIEDGRVTMLVSDTWLRRKKIDRLIQDLFED